MVEPTLGDLGERRIIAEILGGRYRKSAPNFGDDCVVLALDKGLNIVLTTDPCPEPMASALGFDDWFYRGWLLATINLSDLAAAGARPLGLLTAYELPSSTAISDFVRLLEGVDACLAESGTSVIGGNIKEASWISLSATACGLRESVPTRRQGAHAGDAIYFVGPSGRFWGGVLARQSWPDEIKDDSPLLDPVLRPRPQMAAGLVIASRCDVRSVTDNSDGLYTTLLAIGMEAQCGFDLEMSDHWVTDAVARMVAERRGIDPVRLALGWGDWQLIVVVPESGVKDFEQTAHDERLTFRRLGTVSEKQGVRASYKGRSGQLMALESERFTPTSWMSSGLSGYINALVGGELIRAE